MTDIHTIYRVKALNGREIFFYKGTIQQDDKEFLWFRDQKLGLLQLNKSFIISIQEIGNEESLSGDQRDS